MQYRARNAHKMSFRLIIFSISYIQFFFLLSLINSRKPGNNFSAICWKRLKWSTKLTTNVFSKRNMCLHTIFCLTYIIHPSLSPHFYFYYLLTFILPSRQGNFKWDYKHLTCVSSSADLNDSFLSLMSFCVPLRGLLSGFLVYLEICCILVLEIANYGTIYCQFFRKLITKNPTKSP